MRAFSQHLSKRYVLRTSRPWGLTATDRFLLLDIFFRGVEQITLVLQLGLSLDRFAFVVNCLTVIQFSSQYILLLLFLILSGKELHALRPPCCFHQLTKDDILDTFIVDMLWCITLTIRLTRTPKNPDWATVRFVRFGATNQPMDNTYSCLHISAVALCCRYKTGYSGYRECRLH